eukprot:Plantae.Rhodophyta-Palmaria_palmata.ctg8024.p1 GENE.Plantae.Rhodophyta-Palmaria_palmata.ctg8024~~Plantae.Rhodophyta-Palmaria_palmata.ctg8024.p1  ORF type:complete len:129 (-),score=16.79 Plantae.Rhodophyta-Palmaria_palmata.ctg8024:683-1069(-)
MFMAHINSVCCGEGYDGSEVLRDLKVGTELLFLKVNAIRSYRVFLMIADDGKMEMSVPVSTADVSVRMPSSGAMYKRSTLEREIVLLKERSIVDVFLAAFDYSFSGIGSGVACTALPLSTSSLHLSPQ